MKKSQTITALLGCLRIHSLHFPLEESSFFLIVFLSVRRHIISNEHSEETEPLQFMKGNLLCFTLTLIQLTWFVQVGLKWYYSLPILVFNLPVKKFAHFSTSMAINAQCKKNLHTLSYENAHLSHPSVWSVMTETHFKRLNFPH